MWRRTSSAAWTTVRPSPHRCRIAETSLARRPRKRTIPPISPHKGVPDEETDLPQPTLPEVRKTHPHQEQEARSVWLGHEWPSQNPAEGRREQIRRYQRDFCQEPEDPGERGRLDTG